MHQLILTFNNITFEKCPCDREFLINSFQLAKNNILKLQGFTSTLRDYWKTLFFTAILRNMSQDYPKVDNTYKHY